MSRELIGPAQGDVIEAKIESLDDSARGEGVADGDVVVHVPGALPGEKVKAEVEFVDRHGRRFARLLSVLERSEDRAQPGCPHFGRCPGCDLLHMSFAAQYRWKRKELAEALELDDARIDPVVPSPRPFGWQSRVKLVATESGTLGVRVPKSDEVADMHGCLVHAPEVERIADAVRSLIERAREPIMGLTGLSITASLDEGRALVTLETRSGAVGVEGLASVLAMRSDVAYLARAVHEDVDVVVDKGPITERFGEVRHRLSTSGLGPSNPLAAAAVHALLVEHLQPAGRRVLDLYAGSGGITLALAKGGAREVVAVEAHGGALADLRATLALEKDLEPAVQLVEWSVEEATNDRVEAGERFDLVVLDPPKKGASRQALDGALGVMPARIAYIGREPRVFSRDLSVLLASDAYELGRIIPVDVAPHTRGLEAIAILNRRG